MRCLSGGDKMKKRILAAMMAAVMVFSMAGCGSKADEKTDDTA